jgi:hypothetical protein
MIQHEPAFSISICLVALVFASVSGINVYADGPLTDTVYSFSVEEAEAAIDSWLVPVALSIDSDLINRCGSTFWGPAEYSVYGQFRSPVIPEFVVLRLCYAPQYTPNSFRSMYLGVPEQALGNCRSIGNDPIAVIRVPATSDRTMFPRRVLQAGIASVMLSEAEGVIRASIVFDIHDVFLSIRDAEARIRLSDSGAYQIIGPPLSIRTVHGNDHDTSSIQAHGKGEMVNIHGPQILNSQDQSVLVFFAFLEAPEELEPVYCCLKRYRAFFEHGTLMKMEPSVLQSWPSLDSAVAWFNGLESAR